MNLATIYSGDDFSLVQHQAITITDVDLLWIESLETNFSEAPCKIKTFPFSKIYLQMSDASWYSRPGLKIKKWLMCLFPFNTTELVLDNYLHVL